MSGDFDPRDLDSRERDDGVHDREDEWLTLGRGAGSAAVRDGDDDVRDRDDDWREERHREPRDRYDDRGGLIRAMCSCATWTCRADRSASWFMTAIVTTR